METPRVLSGHALVAKGITKIDASLPEVGLKDVAPNGSWLEQKQIQAALEARKYLIEVERIEKCGTLSHAEWRDDLMLAEVTQKVGGYWQYLGHNVGKTLYLQPEEALFLMEVNCLLLKHNEVTVSLQKAYSLLLQPPTTMIQYKVYASLSRLGYKVFRHKGPKTNGNRHLPKLSRLTELKNIDSPITSTDNESENVDSPAAYTNKSDYLDSPNISTGNESENTDSPVVQTFNKSEEIVSTVTDVNVTESVDSQVVKSEGKLAENISSPPENIVTDSKNIPIPLEDTVFASENIGASKGTVDENKNVSSAIELKDDKEKVSEDIELEIAENDIKLSDNKDNGENVENTNGQDSSTKEKDTSNVMEVDEVINSKIANNNNESIEEVSSTVTEIVESNNMEICSENQEVDSSEPVAMNECDGNEDVEVAASVEITSLTSDIVMDSVTEVVNDDTNKDVTDVDVQMAANADAKNIEEDSDKSLEDEPNKDQTGENNSTSPEKVSQESYPKDNNSDYSYLRKIDKITKRQIKPTDAKKIEEHFKNISDFSKECVVTVNVPDQQFIPKNIFVHNSNYVLNLHNIKKRSIRSASSDAASYTSSDEVNGANIRRIRSSSGTEFPQNPTFFPNIRFPRTSQFRPYGFWRPQNNMNFYQLMFFQTRVQFHQRAHPFLRPTSYNFNPNNPNISNNARKRMRSGKTAHFQGIKNLAVRLKQSLISGNTDMRNLESLHALLHSYNLRYKSRLRLTENFDVINEEKIVETIELDDDEESKSKKPRLEQEEDKFDENMYRLKKLALRLRDLETKDKATATHRRAFSKAIKTFNKSYNADVYLDEDSYEVIDRRCITLDSSSESDCIVEEEPEANKKKGKRLRNPFNILKRRSERLKSLNNPGTSRDDSNSESNKVVSDQVISEVDHNKYNECLNKVFDETWLPNENDFGRAEIVPKVYMNSRLIHTNKEQYLFDFLKDHLEHHENWAEVKISFLKYLEESNNAFQKEQAQILADSELCNSGLKPLIDFDDSSDMPSVLEKLRIISNNKDIDSETSLRIDFDVYNRDVQNFRKRNPPKPHFRIICIDISSGLPSAVDVMALHSKYEDNVAIVFAIVDTGSISYLQINPIDLPIYVPNSDVV
nr:uncharacterized protein LOC110372068 [Helicoverpa armigera]